MNTVEGREKNFSFQRRLGCTLSWILLLLFFSVSDVSPIQSLQADANRVKKILPQFDAYARSTFKRSGVPGMAIAVVYQDKVQYLKCFGIRKVGSPEAVDADTIFQLASISKSFTSATIASMVGDGLLGWDERVIDHYPEFHLYDSWVVDQITIRDLLSHRSGLPEYIGDKLESEFKYDRQEILYRLRYQRPIAGFRSCYGYQNFLVTAAGEAAAKAVSKKWSDLVAERIFNPLDMSSTSAHFADVEKAENRVTGHVRKNDKMIPQALRRPDAQSPAGGVSSTISDMVKWVRMQLAGGDFEGKRIICVEALKETHKPQTIIHSSDNGLSCYGLGWFVDYSEGHKVVHHGGDFGTGISTSTFLIPSEQVGIVILTNAFPEGHILHTALTKTFNDLFFAGKNETDWWPIVKEEFEKALVESILDPFEHLPKTPSPKTPGLPSSSYVGEYENSYYGKIRVVERNHGLSLYMGHNKVPYKLTHWNGNIFKDEKTNSGMIFNIGSDGRAYEVLVKSLDFGGRNGRFVRTQ
ncbi:serine hydrolase [Candidatus Aerophobetes bacterium Ae_b3b]|nr:MAG: serine hydrolase [Candidatus Aerophobetes bacterium Ae_b3b]